MSTSNAVHANQPYPWSIAVLRVAASLEDVYDVARGHYYQDLDDTSVTVTPNTETRTVTVINRDEGAFTIARPTADLTWQVDTWLTPRAFHDEDTMTLALAVLEAQTGDTPAQYTDHIDPDILDDSHPDHPYAGHERVARLISRVIGLHIEQRDKDQFAAIAPGATLRSHGGVIPFQAYGTWHGYEFYFRYRGGHASLRIGQTSETVVGRPYWSASVQHGDPYDGYMEFHEFLETFATLAAQLAPEDLDGSEALPLPAPNIFATVQGQQ